MHGRLLVPLIAGLLLLALPSHGEADPGVLSDLKDDATWTARAVWGDVTAIVTAPLHVDRLREITPAELLTAAGAVAAIGVAIALDESIRRGAKDIGPHTGREIQDAGTAASWITLGGLYAAGLWEEREDWRHGALTGGESALVSAELVRLTKIAFGRERPDAGQGAYRWFRGGDSFVSDAATPPFAVAEAVSEAFDQRWWAATAAYVPALAVGVGRMGQDRHWASDIIASAVLGIGTERLFSGLHPDSGPGSPEHASGPPGEAPSDTR